MTWFVRHVNRECWVCQRNTKQVVAEEKMDMVREIIILKPPCAQPPDHPPVLNFKPA